MTLEIIDPTPLIWLLVRDTVFTCFSQAVHAAEPRPSMRTTVFPQELVTDELWSPVPVNHGTGEATSPAARDEF